MNLTNHFLVAMPSLQDPYFERSVIYICEHNEDGAMGIMINAPINITIAGMLEKIEIFPPHLDAYANLQQPVHNGGPVAEDRGFILHPPKADYESSIQMSDNLTITTSKDILSDLGTEKEPPKYFVALGYAGWDSGQLETELIENSWLTMEANLEIIFDTPTQQRWQKAMQSLGIDAAQLSAQIGHA